VTAEQIPVLTLLILTPAGVGVLIWLDPRPARARWVALGGLTLSLALALVAAASFDPADAGLQLRDQAAWIPSLGVTYLVGVDGLSVLLLPLTALLFLGALAGSWTSVRAMRRLYFSLLLFLQASTFGVLCALDAVLFFLFWELTLVPTYFLVSLWGVGPHRRYAAVKYTLSMLAGGVPLLFGFLVLAFGHAEASGADAPAGLAFDYPTLLATPLPPGRERLVFLLLLAGFAVKTPLFPVHTWLPVAAREGPTAVVAILLGLKLGAYGLLRFALPLAPAAARELHWLLAALGVVGILYGALAALAQTNLRRMLAYAGVSHVGLVVLGLASFDLAGVQGAVFQLLSFTVVAGGLFLLAGMLHHRLGSTEVASLGGAARSMPVLASTFLLLALASIGIPGTSGFPGELLLIVSAIGSHTGAALAALAGVVLGAAYVLGIYRQAFLGPVRSPLVADATDLRPRELALAGALVFLTLAAGLYPAAVLDLTRAAAGAWVSRFAALPGG
jgi:NADH-quinone oxidoreductase subunit M